MAPRLTNDEASTVTTPAEMMIRTDKCARPTPLTAPQSLRQKIRQRRA
jgi:hypothetical protein